MDLLKKLTSKKERIRARHVAITTDGMITWAKDNKGNLEDAFKKVFLLMLIRGKEKEL